MSKPAYTLVFGLTADPIHKGHEQVILNSFLYAEQNNLTIKQFLLVPTYQPNLIAGKHQPRTAFHHRLKMCELIANKMINQFKHPVYVSDIEKHLYNLNQQNSYSIDTLAAIKASPKLFVLSADHFAGRWPKFRKWHRWQELVKNNGLMIHQRPGHGLNKSFIKHLKSNNPAIHVVTNLPAVEVSSTDIRNQIKINNFNIRNKISEDISEYLLEHHLYQMH